MMKFATGMAVAVLLAIVASTLLAQNRGAQDDLVYAVGGDVTPAVLINSVDPAFSVQASKAHFKGEVRVECIIDKHGIPVNVHVVKEVGYGLDENAVEAVRQYRFNPAMKNGEPVAVKMAIVIRFTMYTKVDKSQ